MFVPGKYFLTSLIFYARSESTRVEDLIVPHSMGRLLVLQLLDCREKNCRNKDTSLFLVQLSVTKEKSFQTLSSRIANTDIFGGSNTWRNQNLAGSKFGGNS